MKPLKFTYLACDFETTVYQDQKFTEVWAAVASELFTDNINVFNSLENLYSWMLSIKGNVCAYFHNLKFDGEFWIHFLITKCGYTQALENDVWLKIKDMKNNTFSYMINNMGLWYKIIIKTNDRIIEIRDSLKLLPFKISEIAKSFSTTKLKGRMKYDGYRKAGGIISPAELEYIKADVTILKDDLEFMFE